MDPLLILLVLGGFVLYLFLRRLQSEVRAAEHGATPNMGSFTKGLAAVGALLAWIPIVAVAVSVTRIIGGSGFRDDDVLKMVAILPVAVVGAGLLYWAALRAHSGRKLVGWGLVLMVGLLVGGLALLFFFVLSYAISMYGSEPSGRWPILWEPPWYTGRQAFRCSSRV